MTVSGHVYSPMHLFPRYSCVLVMPHIVCRHRVSNEARHARRPYLRRSFSDLYRHRRDRASRLFRGVAGFRSPEMVSALHAPRGEPGGHAATLDLLLSGMAGAGHGVAALSFYLGLDEEEVRERAASLGLPEPPEKPLRRPV